jgi:hypothetical protein
MLAVRTSLVDAYRPIAVVTKNTILLCRIAFSTDTLVKPAFMAGLAALSRTSAANVVDDQETSIAFTTTLTNTTQPCYDLIPNLGIPYAGGRVSLCPRGQSVDCRALLAPFLGLME